MDYDELNRQLDELRQYKRAEFSPVKGLKTVVEQGNLEDQGFTDTFGAEYDLGGVKPFARRRSMDGYFDKQYGVTVGDDNLNGTYYVTENPWGKSNSLELAAKLGVFNALLGADTQGDYRNYRVGVNGGNKDLNGYLTYNKDNMGNNEWWVGVNKSF